LEDCRAAIPIIHLFEFDLAHVWDVELRIGELLCYLSRRGLWVFVREQVHPSGNVVRSARLKALINNVGKLFVARLFLPAAKIVGLFGFERKVLRICEVFKLFYFTLLLHLVNANEGGGLREHESLPRSLRFVSLCHTRWRLKLLRITLSLCEKRRCLVRQRFGSRAEAPSS